MLVDLIERDDLFWKGKMEIPLSEFYLNHILLEIISPSYSI